MAKEKSPTIYIIDRNATSSLQEAIKYINLCEISPLHCSNTRSIFNLNRYIKKPSYDYQGIVQYDSSNNSYIAVNKNNFGHRILHLLCIVTINQVTSHATLLKVSYKSQQRNAIEMLWEETYNQATLFTEIKKPSVVLPVLEDQLSAQKSKSLPEIEDDKSESGCATPYSAITSKKTTLHYFQAAQIAELMNCSIFESNIWYAHCPCMRSRSLMKDRFYQRLDSFLMIVQLATNKIGVNIEDCNLHSLKILFEVLFLTYVSGTKFDPPTLMNEQQKAIFIKTFSTSNQHLTLQELHIPIGTAMTNCDDSTTNHRIPYQKCKCNFTLICEIVNLACKITPNFKTAKAFTIEEIVENVSALFNSIDIAVDTNIQNNKFLSNHNYGLSGLHR